MNNRMKTGAATLALAALVSGCAPTPANTAQAGATGDYGAYGTTTNTGSTDYGYGSGSTGTNTNTSYSSYGTGTTTGTGGSAYGTGGASSYYDYSAPGSSTGSSSYSSGGYSSGGYSSGSGYTSVNPVGGSHAVQVVASSNRSTADAVVSQMSSMGFNAVVDQVGGLYKVRVPFSSESEAKSSLGRIRSSVPDAFYTVR